MGYPLIWSKCYNPNMDVELDPDPELAPHMAKLKHRWDWNHRKGGL